MSQLVISQPLDERALSMSFVDRAEIIGLRILRSSTRCEKRIEDLDGRLAFALTFRPDDYQITSKRVFVTTAFQFKAFLPSDPGTTILILSCKLESEYVYRGEQPDSEQVSAFGKGNAILAIWGFLREFAYSSIVRMGFPPPVLPFLRLEAKSSDERSKKRKPHAVAKTTTQKQEGEDKARQTNRTSH